MTGTDTSIAAIAATTATARTSTPVSDSASATNPGCTAELIIPATRAQTLTNGDAGTNARTSARAHEATYTTDIAKQLNNIHSTYELVKSKEPRTPNPDHNDSAQSIQPINGSQTNEQENRNNTNEYLLAKLSNLGGNRVKGKRKERDKGAHRIEVIDINPHNTGEHLIAEDIGEHLFAETKD